MSEPRKRMDEELYEVLKKMPPLKGGETCYGCGRKVPEKKSDDRPGPTRSVVSIHEPAGEEGTLEMLMINLVEKFREQFPLEHDEMKRTVGLEVIGGTSWKYHAVHFALYACLMVPGLEPVSGEE